MHFDDILKAVLEIFPNAELGEDNEGQLIVHTDLQPSVFDPDTYIPRS